MRKTVLAIVALAGLMLAGCASTIQNLEGVFNTVSTATVDPKWVNIALNTYYPLKGAATGYATYCIQHQFPQPACSAANRRAVIRFVKAGDGAAASLAPALSSGEPLLATTYNTLVGAINSLKAAPISVANN